MVTVIVFIHLFIAIVMIGLILLQKTEGNAAGGGFSASSSMGNMQPRARPNALGRATAVLGIAFFATSLGLALVAKQAGPTRSVLDAPAADAANAPKVNDIRGEGEPTPPTSGVPAPGAPAPLAPSFNAPAAPAAPAVPAVPSN
jgi:preprotein translocase subunit SecG